MTVTSGDEPFGRSMAKEWTPDRSLLPSTVEVTVLPDPRGRPLRERILNTSLAPTARAIVVVAMVGAFATGPLYGERMGAPRRARAPARNPGPAGVAAAYGFPLRCLSVTTVANDPEYARADFNRASECGRYAGDVTAIFKRVDGAWRPVLEALGYSCPVASLPIAVQAGLAVCPQSDLPAQRHR